jgi:hypothetical protein
LVEISGLVVTNWIPTSWTSSNAPSARGLLARFQSLEANIAGWTLAFLLLFGTLKLVAIVWFLSHGVDPFSDYPAWRIPLLLAGDLTASCGLGITAGLLASPAYQSRFFLVSARFARWLIALLIMCIASINLRIIEVYRAVLDRYLILKVGNPSVMKESIVANMDATFITSMLFGLCVVAFVPSFVKKRMPSGKLARSYGFFGAIAALAVVPLLGARSALSGRETFGLKHNAVLALAFAPPEVFQFADPKESYARLSAKLPQGPDLHGLVQWSPQAERTPGHPELAGRAAGYNVVFLRPDHAGAVCARATIAAVRAPPHQRGQHVRRALLDLPVDAGAG